MDDSFNENAKYVLKGFIKALQQSKNVCESGKMAIKTMETVLLSI